MSSLSVSTWPISKITPFSKNARVISQRAVEKVAASIKEFGWRQPIVVDRKGVIVVGHVRYKAALFLKLKEVPVHQANDLTPTQIRLYRLADNRLSEETGWDDELLAAELAELSAAGADLEASAFDPAEFERILNPGAERQTKADKPVLCPTADRAVSRKGDIWILGPHRIACGDSTDQACVEPLLAGARPMLMVTDPPYSVEYDPAWRNETINRHAPNKNTAPSPNDDRVDWTPAWRLFPGDVMYVWHSSLHAGEVATSIQAAGFGLRSMIIWRKQHFAMSRGHYHWQHEPCWYAARTGKTARWLGDRKQTSVWDVASLNAAGKSADDLPTGHSCQKPVELMRRSIVNHLKRGELVYDPFSGSGSTLMAAEISGRACLAMDLDPRFVDLAILRWEELTGKEAALAETGETYKSLRATRVGRPKASAATKTAA